MSARTKKLLKGIAMEKVVRLFVSKMIEQNVIEEQRRAVISYGLELFFSSVINILSILLISVLINREGGIILLLLVSVPLQSFGGGYHCNTHLRCWILTTGGYLAAVLGAVYIPVGVLICFAVISAYPFFRLSPVENPMAPFGDKFKEKMKKVVRIAYLLGILISLILLVFESEGARFILAGISMEGVSVLGAECKRKRLE